MQLSKEEEDALDGKYGDTLALAYRVLIAIGNAMDADRLISISWAHVSGVNYNTIGDAGLRFLEDISNDKDNSVKVRVRTTLNPTGYDPSKVNELNLNYKFIEKQSRIMKAYERLGIIGSYTCIPYEALDTTFLPRQGSQVSIAESNAAIYANSILGLLTNKESAISALASALTGKAPYSNLRIQEARKARLCIEVKHYMDSELDYALLGYYAGRFNEDCIMFKGIRQEDLFGYNNNSSGNSVYATEPNAKANVKALCSALGTSGSAGMFTLNYQEDTVKERVEFTKHDASRVMDELSNTDDGDVIVFGSPQLGLGEISRLVYMLKGRRFKKKCMIFCARSIYYKAKSLGYIDALENANASVYCDCCSCLTPLISKDDVDSIITNSVKAAYYLRSWNRVDVCLSSMKRIVEMECI